MNDELVQPVARTIPSTDAPARTAALTEACWVECSTHLARVGVEAGEWAWEAVINKALTPHGRSDSVKLKNVRRVVGIQSEAC